MTFHNHNIHTVADLMIAAATALDQLDSETLETLKRISEDWMQGDHERNAQRAMLDAMLDAVYKMDYM